MEETMPRSRRARASDAAAALRTGPQTGQKESTHRR
jgi:hypothetical protein